MIERARRLSTWARAGYAARGIVYLIIGWLAFDSNRPLSAGEAIESVRTMPAGPLLLILLTLGLFGYGLYKIVFAVGDFDHDGTEPKGLVKRGARFVGGLAYWVLAFISGRALLSGGGTAEAGRAQGSNDGAIATASEIAKEDGWNVVMMLVGLAIIGTGLAQLWIALKAKFMEEMRSDTPALVRPAGQLGYAARGLVILIVGWFALQAGIDGDALRDFGDALAVVRESMPVVFKAIAAGLILFGLVSLAMARYRMCREADLKQVAREVTPGA